MEFVSVPPASLFEALAYAGDFRTTFAPRDGRGKSFLLRLNLFAIYLSLSYVEVNFKVGKLRIT